MPTTTDRTRAILRKYLDADFTCMVGEAGVTSAEQIEHLGHEIGCRFPSEFIAHCTGDLPGLYVEVKEEKWPRPKLYEVGPTWSFQYGLFVYSLSSDAPEWMQLVPALEEFRKRTGRALTPCFGIVGDADIYLFDSVGEIVRWNHETYETDPFGGSFFDLLEQEIKELRERKDLKISGA